jgi:uncharacterized protein YbjT (DUF2867 family)
MVVCVLGASGDLGRRVCAGLRARGVEHRPLSRRGDAVFADLADVASLDRAFAGGTSLFLVSSPVPEQVQLETNAIDAAERAGMVRIVKVSNIPIAGLDRGVHGNHRAIERRLASSSVPSTVLQPSFFTTVVERQRELIARGTVVLPFGPGRVAWVDPQDIADVAVGASTRDLDGPLRLTGPEALDGDEVAARLGVERRDPLLTEWHDAVVRGGLDPWLAESTVELYAAVARDALADVSPDVERVLGRPPRRAFVVQETQ